MQYDGKRALVRRDRDQLPSRVLPHRTGGRDVCLEARHLKVALIEPIETTNCVSQLGGDYHRRRDRRARTPVLFSFGMLADFSHTGPEKKILARSNLHSTR